MAKTIIGTAGGGLPNLTPTVTIPEPGDDADATVVEAAVQEVLDELATTSARARSTTLLIDSGVPMIMHVDSIAELKAINQEIYGAGQLVMVKATTVVGGVLRGGGLFMCVNESMSERTVPGVPDAYLVVQPASGPGRWLNVAASLGWADNGFRGQVRQDTSIDTAEGVGPAFTPVLSSGAWVATPVEIEVQGVKPTDRLDVSFNFSANQTAPSPTHDQRFRITYSRDGGAFTNPSDAATRGSAYMPAQVTWVQTHHLELAFGTVITGGDYRFRVEMKSDEATHNTAIVPDWRAIALRHYQIA